MHKHKNGLGQGYYLHNWQKYIKYSPPPDLETYRKSPTTKLGNFPMNWKVELWSRSSS